MGNPDNKIVDIVEIFRSWIPRRSETVNVSRDFWMPDQSCRVCYECDSPFTVFNRKHHCRLCGRVFCAKCTVNSIPVPQQNESRSGGEDWERVRVCNYCFKQWKQETNGVDNGVTELNHVANTSPGLSPSPSAISLASTKSSCTCNSSSGTAGSIPHSTGPYQRVECSSGVHHQQSSLIDATMVGQDDAATERSTNPSSAALFSSPDQFGFFTNKSDDEDDDYGDFQTVSRPRHVLHADGYYGPLTMDQIDCIYQSHDALEEGNHDDTKNISFSSLDESLSSQAVDRTENTGEEAKDHSADECEAHTHDLEPAKTEPVDFENNGLLWIPPEPEDEDDDREAALFDDDDDGVSASGEWGYLRPSNSFGGGEYRSRDKSSEEHKRALTSVVEGHFRALIAQLLQVENIPVGEEDDKESWLEIITSLSWEAATLLKPDTSKGGGMDPGGYVKVKCLARGRRSESIVIKGVVCKKNVAHRRMKTKVDKPRFLILGGALEYQRVSNLLSSVDTLLQQEMDHLKMAVAKIAAHHPNVLLVEKSVSRYAQEYLLTKDISLVLNIKRPLLERIARCTGAQIVPSIDYLTSPKLGHCDLFHVEKFLEEHGSAGQGGKKLTKTLMSFEGCPKPLGYTILLKGANGDELKKLKHVIQYGVFAAYHLALETSFLADEGATLPELPLKSPITVALPDKLSSIDRSISTIPGFTVPGLGKPSGSQHTDEVQKVDKGSGQVPKSSDAVFSDISSSINVNCSSEGVDSTCFSESASSQTIFLTHTLSSIRPTGFLTSLSPSGQDTSSVSHNKSSSDIVAEKDNKIVPHESFQLENSYTKVGFCDYSISSSGSLLGLDEGASYIDGLRANLHATSMLSLKKDGMDHTQERGLTKEDFPPSPSDHQSILVSLSTRCVWKGTVCDRAHLFRIKYYGTFDKPLGRFLRDHLFDQDYRCESCNMPSEAHVYCYTHRQGSLAISIKKFQEFLLPGEKEGKIWMWHRCLRCPRENGFPPATRRVVMSDAAWGLSFGKFLELSFSNHAAASRVASCGHSLHRDCLRFYGFGRMIACFRYASISVHSVYLPPQKLEFSYDKQDWIEKEAKEVRREAELLFTEVRNVLQSMSEKIVGERFQDGSVKALELSRLHVIELEGMLEKEKEEFEESLGKMLSRKVKLGQHAVDILELNKLRRQILLHSYVWDQRLIHAATLSNTSFLRGQKGLVSYAREKGVDSMEKLAEVTTSRSGKGFIGCDSFLESKPEMDFSHGGHDHLLSHSSGDYRERDRDFDLNPRKVENCFSSSQNMNNETDCLDSGKVVRRIQSEGEFSNMGNLSDTLDAAWTGKSNPGRVIINGNSLTLPGSVDVSSYPETKNLIVDKGGNEAVRSPGVQMKRANSAQNFSSCSVMSFPNSYNWLHRNSSLNGQKLCIGDYIPVYISCFKELERQSGARLLLPVGINDVFVPVYDDEPTSIVAYALLSSDYHVQSAELEKPKECGEVAMPLLHCDQVNPPSANNIDDSASDGYRSIGSTNESTLSISGSRGSQSFDPLLFTKDLHVRVSFTDDGPLGKVKYTVTCYYAKCFEALRKICCPSELDFIRSLSRCKKWGAQGGKSNVFFAKTLDDRFIIKQVTKTELESFIKFGPSYFKYLSESISTRSPTCLAKILGIYQVLLKNVKSGKESKMDILVMENLLFRRNITRVYDLKGSSRSRYNSDTSGDNKVLLDQNLIEAMPTSPIFVGNKAKRLLERAVWNDTSFLATVDVMDYSLLVGVDEEKHELVLGIIDFMRQYTWDKHLETWVKASGILGGSKNALPTVISPEQYKKRFRKAMTAYFIMVPDQWSTSTVVPSESQSDLCEEKLQTASSMD